MENVSRPITPAEERATRDGLTVVPLVRLEALRIAAGNPMIVRTLAGEEVLVRLFEVDEFIRVQHAAADEHGGTRITRELAAEIVSPW